MKRILLSILVFFMIFQLGAQDFKILLREARLVEKHNQVLRDLPRVLLEAYCKGDIAGYYPNYPKAQVSFTEMLNYANLEDPSLKNGELSCPGEFCELSRNDLITFQQKIEFIEFEKPSTLGTEFVKEIHFFRLKILRNGRYYNGPVFYYKDIEKLGEEYQLYNPDNDAISLPIKKVVLARMFSSKIIKRYGVPEYKNGQNKVTTDDDLYEY